MRFCGFQTPLTPPSFIETDSTIDMIIKTVNEFKLTIVHFGCPNGCRYGVGCQAFVSLGSYWAVGCF